MATTAPTVTLKHLGAALAEGHNLSKRKVDAILREAIDLIVKHLKKGARVQITGLGNLRVSDSSDREDETDDLPPSPKDTTRVSGSAASKSGYVKYITKRIIKVDPEHSDLEKEFNKFLRGQGASDIVSNKNRVDVSFRYPEHGPVIAELKPAKSGETCYAIRMAIGQVLEYRHDLSPNKAIPMIVLDAEPQPREKDFVSSIGIALSWKNRSKAGFDINWPKSSRIYGLR